MDWLETVRRAVDFIESHLTEDITAADAARAVFLSPFYFSRGFAAISGYTVGEYIRQRRLYVAAMELVRTDARVLDVALAFGYDSPENFTRAFRRYFGTTPAEVRRTGRIPHPFLPLVVQEQVLGGTKMDVRMEKKDAFEVVGVSRRFENESGYRDIPAWWDRLNEQAKTDPAIRALGQIAVCVDDGEDSFAYWAARPYTGGDVPAGQAVLRIRPHTWAVFTCTGPLPGAMQTVNTQIFGAWLPNNGQWELDESLTVENYLPGDMGAQAYKSEIWLPVRPRGDANPAAPDA